MSILEIRIAPDPILRKKARPVKRVDDVIRKLARDMIETMQEASGVGLAANQVGVLKRVVTIQLPEEEPRVFVNPEITKRVGEREVQEGCLSVPGYYGLINRSVSIRARALDEWGAKFRLSAEELLAQAVEHELDHLNGILFLDHLESHERLWKAGEEPAAPHSHDVDLTIHADHSDPNDGESASVEVLTARATLSTVTADTSMTDLAYDLTAGQLSRELPRLGRRKTAERDRKVQGKPHDPPPIFRAKRTGDR